MNDDAWYGIEGEVVGWLSQTTDGGVGRETMIVRVTKSDCAVSKSVVWYQLRWVGHDYILVKRHQHPEEMRDEVEVGDTVTFNTCEREQNDYAVA